MREESNLSTQKITVDLFSAVACEVLSYPFLTAWNVQIANYPCGLFAAMQLIARSRKEGKGFYTGFSISFLASFPGLLVYLIGKDIPLWLWGDTNTAHLLRGFFAQTSGMLVWGPSTRLIALHQAASFSQRHNIFNQKNIAQKIRYIYQHEGVRGFYRGAFPCYATSVLLDTIGFFLQRKILECFPKEKQKNIFPYLTATIIGFSIGSLVTTPLDVGITHMRINETNPNKFPERKFFPALKNGYRALGHHGMGQLALTHACYTTLWYSTALCISERCLLTSQSL